MPENLFANCSEQIAIAFDKLLSNFTLLFNFYCNITGEFVLQACNICIFKYFKLILNAISPVRRLQRERVYNYYVKSVWNL
jgi:hypothetical protein